MNASAINTQPSFLARLLSLPIRLLKWLIKHPVILVVLIIIGGGVYYWYPKDAQVAAVAPRLSPVTTGNVENTVTAAGQLSPKETVDVGAQVSGQLETLYVEVGDVVEKGQLLAEIDASIQQTKVDSARASLNALKAQLPSRQSQLDLAKLNAERQARMMEEDATSQQEYDNAQSSLIQAEASITQLNAQIIQSEASLSSEEATLGYTKIYAPMDGTVVSISAKEGQTLNANQTAPTILTIADLSVMQVETEVSEADIGKIKKGMPVYFTTLGGGDKRWFSEVRQILPTPTTANNVVLYQALFDVDNEDGSLLTDMTAQVYFVESMARNVTIVPVAALTFTDSNSGRMGGAQGGMNGGAAQGGGMPGGAPQGGMAGGPGGGNMPSGMPAGGSSMPNVTGGQRPQIQAQAQQSGGYSRQDTGPDEGAGNTSPRKATVQRFISEGKYETVEVQIGLTSRINAEVISGLKPGDQVVAGVVQSESQSSGSNSSGPGGMGGFGGGMRMF